MIGNVVNILSAKKFGFIQGKNGLEYFFHVTDFNGDWEKLVQNWSEFGGADVSFEAIKTHKGLRAANVCFSKGEE